MLNRTEKIAALRAPIMADLVIGAAGSTAFAAAPAHMASKDAQQSGIHAYSPARADTGIQTPGLIFSRGYYVGRDPDAAIRSQLVRDGWYGTR
jgi:hypothetical protein